MSVSEMATTCELATTINKTVVGASSIVHTPPPVTTTAHPDYTVTNTGRSTTATQTYLTTKNKNH